MVFEVFDWDRMGDHDPLGQARRPWFRRLWPHVRRVHSSWSIESCVAPVGFRSYKPCACIESSCMLHVVCRMLHVV